MTPEDRCAECGVELAADAPQGLCPRCLLKRGLETHSFATGAQPSAAGAAPLPTDFVPPTPAELAPSFPDLDILEFLGRGGMGVVYKARQKRLDRLVALKILSPQIGQDPAFAERFAREARAMAMLSHPHIVAVHDFGQATMGGVGREPGAVGRGAGGVGAPKSPLPPGEGQGEGGQEVASESETPNPQSLIPNPSSPAPRPLYYFLMEFVDGVNLRRLLDTGKLAPEEALAIVPQICDALQYAHDHGVVHRDIKPENVLLDKEGRVKIADFGLAKLVGKKVVGGQWLVPSESNPQSPIPNPSSLTAAGQIMGTPQYMAPEQIEHPQEVDHRADIYSLGVVFYQMLTGELPIGRFAPPSKKVQIDVRLDEVVLRALEKEPDRRYQQASEMKTRVDTIITTPNDGCVKRTDESESREGVHDGVFQTLYEGNQSRFGVPLVGVSAGEKVIHWPGVCLFVAAMLIGGPLAVVLSYGSFGLATNILPLEPQMATLSLGRLYASFLILALFAAWGVALAMLMAKIRQALAGPIEKLPRLDRLGRQEGTPPTNQAMEASAAVELIQWARGRVKGPAIGLLIVGILNLLAIPAIDKPQAIFVLFLGKFMDFVFIPHLIVGAIIGAISILQVLGALGMRRLERYGLAIAASILAIIVWPSNLIGLPIGIWALLVLSQREVRAAFSQKSRAGRIKGTEEQVSAAVPSGASLANHDQDKRLTTWDWMTRRPWQSTEVREIYAHLTDAEKAKLMWLGLLFGSVTFIVMGTVPVLLASFPARGLLVIGVLMLIVAILAPFGQRWQRRFLCSTAWARQQGFTPDGLRLFDFGGGAAGSSAASRIHHAVGITALVLSVAGIQLSLMGQRMWGLSPWFSFIAIFVPLILGFLAWRSPAGKAAVMFSTLILLTTGPMLFGMAWMHRDLGNAPGIAKEPPPIPEMPLPAKSNGPADDMQTYFNRTQQLVRERHYKEALDRFLWFDEHALEHDPGMSGVRLSFALSYWKNLGDAYPPAKQAMVDMRDRKTRQLQEGRGNAALFSDVAALNRTLGENAATVRLFQAIDKSNPTLAAQCWLFARDQIFLAKQYDIAKKYIPAALKDYTREKARYDENVVLYETPQMGGLPFRQWNENHFVAACLQLIDLATYSGDEKTAQEIRKRAAGVVNDPRLR